MIKDKHPRIDKDANCPCDEDLTAYALNEHDCIDRAAIQSHMEHCPCCKLRYEELRETVEMLLQSEPESIEHADLLPAINEEIDSLENSFRTRALPFKSHLTWRRLKYVATIALLLGAAFAMVSLRKGDNPAPQIASSDAKEALQRGVGWLLKHQDQNGGWSVELLGGDTRHAAALNGLALLAVARSDLDEERLAGIRRGARYLTGLQRENGVFGPSFDRALYNHGIATLALLSAYSATGDDDLRAPIERALAYTRQTQSYTGGWGYGGKRDSEPNNSVTAWQVQSLILADQLGWTQNRNSLRQAVDWLATTIDQRGHFSYRAVAKSSEDNSSNVTMMSAFCLMAAADIQIPLDPNLKRTVREGISSLAHKIPDDYYSAFYQSSALAQADLQDSKHAQEKINSEIISRQQKEGWMPNDRWGAAGGRIYSTAMSLLAISQ